jgi:hypothetical protein
MQILKSLALIAILLASAHAQEIRGKVTANGKPVRDAVVILTDANSTRRTVTTTNCGDFVFLNLEKATYVIGVSKRKYRFASRVVNVEGAVYVEMEEQND